MATSPNEMVREAMGRTLFVGMVEIRAVATASSYRVVLEFLELDHLPGKKRLTRLECLPGSFCSLDRSRRRARFPLNGQVPSLGGNRGAQCGSIQRFEFSQAVFDVH